MKRTGYLLVIGLCISLAACGDGDDDDDDMTPDPPDPSVSAVNPPLAYLGRTMDVVISGSNTTWGSDVAIDFGAGITVSNVRVGSETGLVATITIADDAATGARDVTVGGETYTGAFSVEAPITVGSLEGTPAQGSIVFGTVRMQDLSTPFDMTRTGDGLFTPFEYTNLDVTSGMGTQSVMQGDPTIYSLSFVTLIDVTAPAGPLEMSVDSGPAGTDLVGSTTPAAFDVAARAPVALTEDMPSSANVTKPLDSVLYSMMTTAGKIVTVTINPPMGNADASPSVAILPMSGAWADWVNGDFTPTAKFLGDGSTFYAVAVDMSGEAGYMHTIEFVETDAPEVDDTANGTCAGAIAATPLPYNQVDLALPNQADVDWFAVTVTAADIGKTIHAITSPGEEETDTTLAIYTSDCTTEFAMNVDADYHEDLESPAIVTAGTYYVRVGHSQMYPHVNTFYTLSIALEGP